MSVADSSSSRPGEQCVARAITEALSENPGLEAVTIDRARQSIALATLGRADIPRLTERINHAFEEALDSQEESQCGLLAGRGDCTTCTHSTSDVQQGKVTISHEADSTTISRVTCPTAPSFWRWRHIPLPKVVPREVEVPEDEHGINEWKAQMLAAVLCGVLGLVAWFLRGNELASVGTFLLSYLAGSWFAAQDVWERLRKGAVDVHFLMIAVAVGSAAIGAWGEGATLLFLFSFSGALEHFAMGRTQREIRALFRDAPKTGTVLDAQGHEQEVQLERLRPGLRLLVKPGAQFPIDAEVLKGHTASDESNLTGESAPVEKRVGDKVLAGTINLWGAVEVLALRPAAESALQKIIHLIRHAQRQKAPVQQFTDQFSTYYTYFALGLSLLMFFVWWLVLDYPAFVASEEHNSAFYRTMTLLVVASPCALVLSIPSAVLAAIAWGARHGVLFRGERPWKSWRRLTR
jgi:Zn2+/Cd2+-exporting ATPase